jgi:catechol 2,3-dioxygenase-like lactoylglutathione lyase family enzyme
MSPSDPRVRITRLAHVVYRHPDLPKAAEFLEHFGLDEVERTDTRIYYKGYGPDPYCYVAEKSPSGKREFGGGAWIAESFAELEKATKLPGASPIEKAQGPGGGSIVTVPDPGGHVIKLLYGQEILEPSLHPPKAEMNTAQEKNRVGVFHRMKAGPAKVHKAGHYGYVVPADEFLMLRSWYSTNFNFMLTDTTYNKKTGQDETSFLHVDLGETFVDHHVSICIYSSLPYANDRARLT